MSEQRGHGTAAAAAGQSGTLESVGPPARQAPPVGPASRRLWARPWAREAGIAAAFVAAGVVVTWPRATYLAGLLPAGGGDQAEYVWNMWWVAHQLIHLANPWSTSYLAAPVGIRLGYDTLTPLLGWVMAPVTLAFGPSASYNLLVIVTPGLACYAMYRLARLWLPGWIGPVAAGAFFGLSGMVTYQVWAHVHTAVGVAFLPLAMEAAIRLRRDPAIWRGVVLGVVIGAAVLIDQEFAVLAAVLVILLLLPWLLGSWHRAQLAAVAAGAVTAAVISSPQLIAMIQQVAAGGSTVAGGRDYVKYAAQLPALFAPSPRLASYGVAGLGSIYRAHVPGEGLATYGVVLSLLAVLGLVVAWRRRSARLLGLLWLGSTVLALGPTLYLGGHEFVPLAERWQGLRVSLLMPLTWLIRVPGLSSFREPDRFALVGLVGAALLAGAAVHWLRQHARPALIAVVAFGVIEAGWPGSPQATIPTALPAVDRPIAADHSGSIVVDVPFGIIGVPASIGARPSPLALVLATADGHPRAASYTSWTTPQTLTGISGHAFYAGLMDAEHGKSFIPTGIAAGRRDLRTLHVGWVLVWLSGWMNKLELPGPRPNVDYPVIFRYLRATGFHLDYQASGVVVYRL